MESSITLLDGNTVTAITELNTNLQACIELQQYTFALLLLGFVVAVALYVWRFYWAILKTFMDSYREGGDYDKSVTIINERGCSEWTG